MIELFQVEICLSQQHEKSTNYFGGHKIEERLLWNFYFQFTNQCVFSFRFTNLLVCFFLFRSPLFTLWLIVPRGCNKERRMVVKLFCLVQPLFPLNKIVSDYKDKFQIENFSEIQSEHKVFPRLQTFITRKLLYVE